MFITGHKWAPYLEVDVVRTERELLRVSLH